MTSNTKLQRTLAVVAGMLLAGNAFAAGGISAPESMFRQIYDAMTTISPILAVIFFCFAGWRYFVQGAKLEMLVAPIGGGIICAAAPWFVQMLFGVTI